MNELNLPKVKTFDFSMSCDVSNFDDVINKWTTTADVIIQSVQSQVYKTVNGFYVLYTILYI